jgi:hypothetical protein
MRRGLMAVIRRMLNVVVILVLALNPLTLSLRDCLKSIMMGTSGAT